MIHFSVLIKKQVIAIKFQFPYFIQGYVTYVFEDCDISDEKCDFGEVINQKYYKRVLYLL